MKRAMLAYKIFRASEFQAFRRDGESAGAPVDIVDGYIHLSTADQVQGTLSKHFAAEVGLHLLAVDTANLTPLKWEESRGGAKFPHLYRELRMTDVLWIREIISSPDGHDTGDLA